MGIIKAGNNWWEINFPEGNHYSEYGSFKTYQSSIDAPCLLGNQCEPVLQLWKPHASPLLREMLVVVAINSEHSGSSSAHTWFPDSRKRLPAHSWLWTLSFKNVSRGPRESAHYSIFRKKRNRNPSNRRRGKGCQDGKQVPWFKKKPQVWRMEGTEWHREMQKDQSCRGLCWSGTPQRRRCLCWDPQPACHDPVQPNYLTTWRDQQAVTGLILSLKWAPDPAQRWGTHVPLEYVLWRQLWEGPSPRSWGGWGLASEEGGPGRGTWGFTQPRGCWQAGATLPGPEQRPSIWMLYA